MGLDFSRPLELLLFRPSKDSTINSGDGLVSDKAGVDDDKDFGKVSVDISSSDAGFSLASSACSARVEEAGSDVEYSRLAGVEVDDEMVLTDINEDDRSDESGKESIDTLSMSTGPLFFEHTLTSSSSGLL